MADQLEYLEQKVLHAVNELYTEYSRPVGARTVSSKINYRDDGKIRDILQRLEKLELLDSPRPGTWQPPDAKPEDAINVPKNIVRENVRLLEHALDTKPPAELKNFVAQWCEDMELHLA